MSIKEYIYEHTLVLGFSGEIDESTASSLRLEIDHRLSHGQYENVIFDFSGVAFMDSTGIGLLLGRYKLLKSHAIPVYILHPNSAIDKLFTLSGIYYVMPKVACVEELYGGVR